MNLTFNNQTAIDDIVKIDNSWTIVITESDENTQVLPAAGIATLDFWHITDPVFFKITASVPVHITMWTTVINNVSHFEIKWEIWTVAIENSSAAEESIVRFLVAK